MIEKPGLIDRVGNYLDAVTGGDPEDIAVVYAGGREALLTARAVAEEAMGGIEFDIIDPTPRIARRVLAARREIYRERLPEVLDLHAGEDMEHGRSIRVGTLADVFNPDRNPRWGG